MLSEPIIWLLFERGAFDIVQTQNTAAVLSMFMLGLLPLGLAKLFSLFLYATYRQGKAAIIATISVVANIIASLILMHPMGASGVALAGSIGGWVLFIYTVKEVGMDRFMQIIKSKMLIYLLLSMTSFAILLYYVNILLLEWIR